jgi:hypothetical protein
MWQISSDTCLWLISTVSERFLEQLGSELAATESSHLSLRPTSLPFSP